jgi:hypothetical protein
MAKRSTAPAVRCGGRTYRCPYHDAVRPLTLDEEAALRADNPPTPRRSGPRCGASPMTSSSEPTRPGVKNPLPWTSAPPMLPLHREAAARDMEELLADPQLEVEVATRVAH